MNIGTFENLQAYLTDISSGAEVSGSDDLSKSINALSGLLKDISVNLRHLSSELGMVEEILHHRVTVNYNRAIQKTRLISRRANANTDKDVKMCLVHK